MVLLADLGYASRSFLRAPGLAATLVLTIGLGVGANASLFAFIGGLLNQPDPGGDGTLGLGRVVVLLAATSGLVLFLACATIASLLLARARARAREMAVRVALGAGTGALVRLCLADTIVLIVAGGAVAGLFGWWASSLFPLLFFAEDADQLAMTPDAAWLLAATAGWLVVLFASSLIPALVVAPRDPMRVLHREAAGLSASAPRQRRWLVKAQIATCCLLLVVAAGIREDLQATLRTARGSALGTLLVVPVLGASGGAVNAPGDPALSALEARLREVPDVVSTALLSSLPGGRASTGTFVVEPSRPRVREIRLDVSTFDATQLDAEQIVPIAGRGFGFRDDASSCRVALINEAASTRYFSGEAVGQSVEESTGTSLEIIGVLPSRAADERPALYLYANQGAPSGNARDVSFYALPRGERQTADLDVIAVSSGYFHVFADPPVAGRVFDARDTATACRGAVVSALAARTWFEGDAVGGALIDSAGERIEVVGAVEAKPLAVAQRAARPLVFLPYRQAYQPVMTLVATATGESRQVRHAVDAVVRTIDGVQILADVITLDEHLVRTSLAAERIAIALVAVCAAMALALATIGVYGAMNDLVVGRRAELALRTALGASATSVVGYVVGAGLRMAVVGLGVGIGLAAMTLPILDRIARSPEWPSLISVSVAALAIGILVIIACAVPAWRAVAVDPREAMQTE